MSKHEIFSDSDAPIPDYRTRRAQTEEMNVRLCRAGGGYAVEGESGRLYLVDVGIGTCSCPDQQKDEVDRCKHLRRVDLELAMGTIPTPDGRLPDPRRPVADGGVDTADDGRYNSGSDGRIDGPLREFDTYGRPIGVHYYRCTVCGVESLRRSDLDDCCPVEVSNP